MSHDGKLSRRGLLGGIGASAALGLAPRTAAAQTPSAHFIDIARLPDSVTAFAGLEPTHALSVSGGEWTTGDISVKTTVAAASTSVQIASPTIALTHVRLRWRGSLSGEILVLGDHWERSYGDLEWRGLAPERPLPWYCAVHTAAGTHCYGVKTGTKTFALWQVDSEGISLWLDLRNGGNGVQLGARVLDAAEIVTRRGHAGEDAAHALHAFCATMAAGRPRRPMPPMFGSNDWYYAYGKNTPAGIERDADLVVSLAPSGPVRPWTIIDDGWQDPKIFPSMSGLAESIRDRGARPGIWIRPMQALQTTDPALMLPVARYGVKRQGRHDPVFDPTIPEALELVLAKVTQAVHWGYELIKHDYTTFELFGQWGNEMGGSPTQPGWSFHDPTRTNAEIVNEVYAGIRTRAGDKTTIIGCNTIGHLSANVFEANRTGDDVSGRSWERTRLMGINTLAFRLPQNRNFFIVDADCVPITKDVDWQHTKMWLDMVARSGTAFILSAAPDTVGPEQRAALRDAFAHAAKPPAFVSPDDWMHTLSPEQWSFGSTAQDKAHYSWLAPDGASPFDIHSKSPVTL